MARSETLCIKYNVCGLSPSGLLDLNMTVLSSKSNPTIRHPCGNRRLDTSGSLRFFFAAQASEPTLNPITSDIPMAEDTTLVKNRVRCFIVLPSFGHLFTSMFPALVKENVKTLPLIVLFGLPMEGVKKTIEMLWV